MKPRPIHRGWLTIHQPRPDARLRLFCVPFAGAGASMFRTWAAHLPEAVEVCAVQLPGRENRVHEPLYTDMTRLVPAAADALSPHLTKPFAFFGHSMGAHVAFELTRALRRRGGPLPRHLYVSGRWAPQIPPRDPPTYDLPDAEFRQELRRLNGGRQAASESSELTTALLPMIRADFAICETYAYEEGPPLACPIAAWGGANDPDVTVADVQAWRDQTTTSFSCDIMPGDHFFLLTSEEAFLASLSGRLATLLETISSVHA